jgi:hypothetical protein
MEGGILIKAVCFSQFHQYFFECVTIQPQPYSLRLMLGVNVIHMGDVFC